MNGLNFKRILGKVITSTFSRAVGKSQCRKEKPKAFLVTFNLHIDYNAETGYRHLDLLIYAPHNYVGVYARERGTVISVADLEETFDFELVPTSGKNYSNFQDDWKCYGYHDSGWVECVDTILDHYEKKIYSINILRAGNNFYQIVDVPTDLPTRV